MTGSEAGFEDRTGSWTGFEVIACSVAGNVSGTGSRAPICTDAGMETDEVLGVDTEVNRAADISVEADDGVSSVSMESDRGSGAGARPGRVLFASLMTARGA